MASTLQEALVYVLFGALLSASMLACGEGDAGPGTTPIADLSSDQPVWVEVLLDGEAAVDVLVMQGGNTARWTTGPAGTVEVMVDLQVPGTLYVLAAHGQARVRGETIVAGETDAITIELTRYDTTDNEAYTFRDPGEPGESHVIEKCAHCHVTMADTWFDSAHRFAAKNPLLQDVYAGTASGLGDEDACAEFGGTWKEGVEPGTGAAASRCFVTSGAHATASKGACADCHAPGIDGKLGGRDLHEATGLAYEYGVHCDVCHRIESVHMDEPAGVAGRLHLHRPGEAPKFSGLGEFAPLTFCPNPDVPNVYMGCVPRDHFRTSELCGGCHELEQAALVEGTSIDHSRWPEGKIPVHSTLSEWEASGMAPGLPCQGCHMPVAHESVTNGADLQMVSAASTGLTGGWPRPHGSVHLHTWSGPKSPEAVRLASPLTLGVLKTLEDGILTAEVTVTNVGAGHAMPTGEPMRAVLLLVEASCGETALAATGGDAVPDFGGALDWRGVDKDWNTWPGAQVGEVIRVVNRPGGHHDYVGLGPFGDGTFSAAQKGLPVETVSGQATITAVEGDTVTFDGPLPTGERAYRVSADAWAGHAGFAFARVLVDSNGERMVPHFLAVDVASDNRLLAAGSWTSTHIFDASCEDPSVEARLIGRAIPLNQSRIHGWSLRDTTISTLTQ